ncbi:MAG: hypothetical protein ABIH20_02330 [Candidatus Diapherotrites archaeon]
MPVRVRQWISKLFKKQSSTKPPQPQGFKPTESEVAERLEAARKGRLNIGEEFYKQASRRRPKNNN